MVVFQGDDEGEIFVSLKIELQDIIIYSEEINNDIFANFFILMLKLFQSNVEAWQKRSPYTRCYTMTVKSEDEDEGGLYINLFEFYTKTSLISRSIWLDLLRVHLFEFTATTAIG